MGKINKILSGKWSIAILLLLIIGVNGLASFWHARLDFTDEKRFTLSNHTIQLLSQIQEPVNITVLLDGDLKSEFKKLSNSSNESKLPTGVLGITSVHSFLSLSLLLITFSSINSN